MPCFIYILHFEEPYYHAQHYIGCTKDPLGRLQRHSIGRGANLLRVIREAGIEWRLGGLHTTSAADMRRVERETKNQNNARRYCEACNPESGLRIGGATSYPIGCLPFAADSKSLRIHAEPFGELAVHVSDAEKETWILANVRNLMSQNRDELGFIPVSGVCGLTGAAGRGQIFYATVGGIFAGYLTWTESEADITIHQICVRDAERGCGIGAALIGHAKAEARKKVKGIRAKVLEDLPANGFWLKQGFTVIDKIRHKTSGNVLNTYYYLDPYPLTGEY